MKSTLKVGATFAVLCCALFAAGCGNKTLVEVRVIHQKTYDQYNGGMCEKFPHIVVERTDTGERIMMSDYTLGTTGDVFKVKHCDLYW